MSGCAMCGGKGFVYRASVVAGRAVWAATQEVPEVVQCPLCYVKDLVGT